MAEFQKRRKGALVMVEVDELIERLDQNQNIDRVRLDILNLISKCLNDLRGTFGCWEKEHMAKAIVFLSYNFSSHPSSTFWLRTSLSYVEKAFSPPEMRSENVRFSEECDSLTLEQLVADVQKLGALTLPTQ
ncbi:hypothetical protein [Methylotenera versatilis]|uniref:hypothetical protein n=1 Tax=Methylotenera versatilis TaxID=1055487 RepID=UPI000648EFA9|nr:hypothetical protein [Methylotenera versatilis]